MKVMFSAGEVSGDLHGARLAEAILAQEPAAELIGFGGQNMAAAGVRLVADLAEYSVMGVWAVIKNIRKIFRLLDLLTATLERERPDILVLIDYPDFNWRLAKRAKERGIKVFSYVPPSAWAWRKGRAKKCAALADEFAAIYPFEVPVYRAAGAKINCWGNPLVDTVVPSLSEEEAREYFGITEKMRSVLLLPGSRGHEIEMLLPVMLDAAKKLAAFEPDTEFFLPVAQGRDVGQMAAMAEECGVRVYFTHDHTYDLMGLGEFALATSGTVVMEAALMGLPCVILYKFSPLSAFIGRLVVHIDNFSLPNILLGERVQTELLQEDVTAENIFAAAKNLYRGQPEHDRIAARLCEAARLLGEPGAARRVAARILACARGE